MAYYADSVTSVKPDATNRYMTLTCACAYDAVQVYIDGELAGAELCYDGVATITIPPIRTYQGVWLLAVDAGSIGEDYFDEAFPEADASKNRIKLSILAECDYLPTDIAKFYRGDAGDALAATLIDEQPVHPGGRGSGGYGTAYGAAYGIGNFGGGYGTSYGSRYGFEARIVSCTTEAMGPGIYPVKVVVVDAAGNTSTEDTDSVTLATYAAPASGLTIESYASGTDALVLSWTPSGDFA